MGTPAVARQCSPCEEPRTIERQAVENEMTTSKTMMNL